MTTKKAAATRPAVEHADERENRNEDDLSEWERFKRLTQKLVNTPKPGKDTESSG